MTLKYLLEAVALGGFVCGMLFERVMYATERWLERRSPHVGDKP